MIKTYIKKPYFIEAIKYTGNNKEELIKLTKGSNTEIYEENNNLILCTSEGDILIDFDNYIIKGKLNTFYPCSEDVFEKFYDEFL